MDGAEITKSGMLPYAFGLPYSWWIGHLHLRNIMACLPTRIYVNSPYTTYEAGLGIHETTGSESVIGQYLPGCYMIASDHGCSYSRRPDSPSGVKLSRQHIFLIVDAYEVP